MKFRMSSIFQPPNQLPRLLLRFVSWQRNKCFPSLLWHCLVGWQEGHLACKIWLLVCWWWQALHNFSSSCHHHLYHLFLQWNWLTQVQLEKWLLKRESERQTDSITNAWQPVRHILTFEGSHGPTDKVAFSGASEIFLPDSLLSSASDSCRWQQYLNHEPEYK